MNTRLAEQIADAVLYEGYVLYPYRASAAKNRFRWQVGLVTPRSYAEAAGSDPWFVQTECLAEIDRGARLSVRVRCLHQQQRTIERPDPDGTGWDAVQDLVVDGQQLIPWDEAVVADFTRASLPIDATRQQWTCPWILEAASESEAVHDGAGQLAARVLRRRDRVETSVRIETESSASITKIRVRVENLTPCPASTLAEREQAVRLSLAGTHTMLAIENGAFLSLLEPPASAAARAAACVNTHSFPVLVGPPGSRGLVLSSPIILYDYPTVAPESPGDFCDATEIDEMLMLRVKTLTDDEKREARATDQRSAAIVDRCDAVSTDTMAQLHGAVRQYAASIDDFETFLNPPGAAAPTDAFVNIGEIHIRRGSRVRLEPTRRADSLDICLRGRLATVTAVYRTLEDAPYVAVALDDDPFGMSGERFRRSLFFHPDEIVPLDAPVGGSR
jgi:hypothetical protein